MKKYIFILILLSTLSLSSCNKNYNVGDTITKDNVSYALYDAKNLGEKVYTKETTDYISSYYYLDMSLEDEYEALKPTKYTYKYDSDDSLDVRKIYNFDSGDNKDFNYTSTNYGLLNKTIFYTWAMNKTQDSSYFWCVTDVNATSITIPDSINGYKVLSVGYNVIKDKNITDLIFEGVIFLMPYAINGTNIDNLTFNESCLLLSCAISNSNIDKITSNEQTGIMDASIYKSQVNTLNIYEVGFDLFQIYGEISCPLYNGYFNTTYIDFGKNYTFKPFFYSSKINDINTYTKLNTNKANKIFAYKDIYYIANSISVRMLYVDDITKVTDIILPNQAHPFDKLINGVLNDYYLNLLLELKPIIHIISFEDNLVLEDNNIKCVKFKMNYAGYPVTILPNANNYNLMYNDLIIVS